MKNQTALFAAAVTAMSGITFGYSSDLVYHCTFDSQAAIKCPAVGSQGTVSDAVTFTSGIRDNAAKIPAYGGECVRVELPNGLPVDKGTIEFDAKIETSSDGFSDRGNPCFLQVNAESGKAMLLDLFFNANNGGGGSGLCLKFGGVMSLATHGFPDVCSSYSAIFGGNTASAWHHYSIVWNTNGIAGAVGNLKVYVDGVEKISSSNAFFEDGSYAKSMSSASCLYFSTPDSTQNRVPYLIDEFKVWKTDTPPEDIELPVVSDVTAKQHYPWCGKVDIGYTVAGPTDGLLVKISVKDNDNGKTYEAKTFDVKPNATVGAHTVVWDATADGVTLASKNMIATVSLVVPAN